MSSEQIPELIIDVRENDEFKAEHIPGSIHIPLGEFPAKMPALIELLHGREVVIMCRTGRRARLALDQVPKLCASHSLKTYEGGILEWKKQGRPTRVGGGAHFPIMRQVQITAGSLVFGAVVLSRFVDPAFVWVAGFVGAGLTFAGLSGFCGMAEVLSRMPWNSGNEANDGD